METVQLGSSSEDDDDVYLNSVAKLKTLKTKQTLLHSNSEKKEEEIQKINEEFKVKAPEGIVLRRSNRKTRSKKNTFNSKSTRQRKKKNVVESDSDLEIISVEEKPNSSKDDLLIVENNLSDNHHVNEDENYEINIKILWRSKDVHRCNIRRNEKFQQIFEYFANLEQISTDEILITKKDKNIKKTDTPVSINLSIIDILEGGIIKKGSTILQKNAVGKSDEDTCLIKIQTTSKKSITISVKRDENFKTLLEKCAQELNIEESKIKLYFDGEAVAITDTPDSLEIEDEACFDLRLSS